jgi:hypothetical protein
MKGKGAVGMDWATASNGLLAKATAKAARTDMWISLIAW